MVKTLLLPLVLVAAAALPAAAQQTAAPQIHVGAPFHDHEELRRVLDLRCTICHTQERIEKAIDEKRDMWEIQERMVERGAQLTERDRDVLSPFWGDPLKQRRTSP